ncbi:MAG: hypothetical protein H6626_13195 [Pseudobdellovibrionaceae bacterium]|nr:hypothetical protein [Bdellovibrionales bacterium]USN47128.1 MAG: hypothetical protein H6626_13195 [Pseudobdellovibrionaceae bacterium]
MRRFLLEVNGQTYKVVAERLGGKLWLHYDGKTIVHSPEGPRRSGGHAALSESPGKIVAPMPGKIIKIHAQLNSKVEVGSPIVTMEAMKMEYRLSAEITGVLADLNCQEGEQVSLGQILAEIKEE